MPIHSHGLDKQREVLRLWLALGVINLLFFYFVRFPGVAPELSLVASLWMLFLWNQANRWPIHWTLNLGLAAACAYLLEITTNTGGINSPAMVWFSLLPVIVTTVMGKRAGRIWLVIAVALILSMFGLTHGGWVDPMVSLSPETILWALSLNVLIVLTQHVVVKTYDKAFQQQLQDLETRNAELEVAQGALLQAQSHKDEFIASMGHELRTPMNAILGLNGLLQAELADRQEDVQLAELIRNSTEQLLSLINDILLLSQLEAHRVNLHPAPSNVRQLLNEVREQWQGVSESKGLVLEVRTQGTVPQWLTLDGPRFKQVLGQLLNNALKYTNQGHVELGVAHRDGQLQVWVADTGEGITPEQQRIIFNRFEQADTRTNRGQGGTGIGLAICKHVVELAGGRIDVVSEPGQGARFDFTWPAPLAAMPVAQAQAQTLIGPGPRCLVVDDHPLNLKVTVMALRQSWPQAEVHTVDGGRAALAWLSQHPVDVVLLDRVMPEFDGLQTVQAIRNHPQAALRHLTVLGLTGMDDEAERTACLQAGMDDVLIKPVSAQTLKTCIEAAWAQRTAPRTNPEGVA